MGSRQLELWYHDVVSGRIVTVDWSNSKDKEEQEEEQQQQQQPQPQPTKPKPNPNCYNTSTKKKSSCYTKNKTNQGIEDHAQ